MTAMTSSPPRSRPAPASPWSPGPLRGSRRQPQRRFGDDAPLVIVDDVLAALRDLAAAARARSAARIVAVTGSVGKTSTKEALALALGADGETHASAASFNNHWGVPLSLARLAPSARYGVFEIGMNHAGEITPLARLVRPHVAVITTVEPVHLEFFASVAAIADAKAEIFLGLEPGGAALLNRDNPHFRRLEQRAAEAGAQRILSFGENAARRCAAAQMRAAAGRIDGRGEHPRRARRLQGRRARQASRDEFTCRARRREPVRRRSRARGTGAGAVRRRRPAAAPASRSNCRTVRLSSSTRATTPIPTSMRAALALLGQAPLGRGGRRIAVLGDMLELGPAGAELHRGLVDPIGENEVDLVFCAGPLMAALWQALPSGARGGYANSAAELEPQVLAAVRSGDVVMVKASAGSRMGPIVKALVRRHSTQGASEPARARG